MFIFLMYILICIFVIMAYNIDDKQIVNNIDINYILDFFKEDECIRIRWNRIRRSNGYPNRYDGNDYDIGDTLIIETVVDKYDYDYRDGGRTVMVDKVRGDIIVNPHMTIVTPEKNRKSGKPMAVFKTEKLRDHILNFKSKLREDKINIING